MLDGIVGAFWGGLVGAGSGATLAARWDWRLAPVGFVVGGGIGVYSGMAIDMWFSDRWTRR